MFIGQADDGEEQDAKHGDRNVEQGEHATDAGLMTDSPATAAMSRVPFKNGSGSARKTTSAAPPASVPLFCHRKLTAPSPCLATTPRSSG